MPFNCWEADARVVSLSETLRWCLDHHGVDRMLAVLRLTQIGNKWCYDEPKAAEFFESQFSSYILTGFQAAEWPGTILIDHPGFVYVLAFDEEVKEAVLRVQPSLAKWEDGENPPLPEDICLFKESATHPVLVSRTHDLDVWLISDTEPNLQGFIKSSIPPTNLFPTGKYFCRTYKPTKTRR
ncbi:MAG TPA: hypothetical protein VJM12_05440 [Pyrinomonadaceae bacterium]|nr:hypothetical protein [Pyrinomonadaceae bacterium]